MIKTASIYSPQAGADSLRVLVTRYWPRGVRKEAQDRWFRLLGPEPALIKAWKSGSLGWDEFQERYLAEYSSIEKKAALDELSALVKGAGGDVTLLCTCMEDAPCHRKILKELLAGRLKL